MANPIVRFLLHHRRRGRRGRRQSQSYALQPSKPKILLTFNCFKFWSAATMSGMVYEMQWLGTAMSVAAKFGCG